MSKSIFFVTGTDTEIGKTVISCTIGRLLNHQQIAFEFKKPVASGCERDFDATSCRDTALLHRVNPSQAHQSITRFSFQEAVAPPLALDRIIQKGGAGIEEPLNLNSIKNFVLGGEEALVICEGVGGICSPMAEDCLNSDLMLALEEEVTTLKVVLVVGSYVGCINHALLSIRQLQSLNLCIHSVIINDCMNNATKLIQHSQLLKKFSDVDSYRMDYFSNWHCSLSQLATRLDKQQWKLNEVV